MSVAFCVGTGRCGTTFLASLAGREPGVAASHERLRLGATFQMYCAWHGIPVDPAGFLADRADAIAADLARARVSFEASALLSHAVTLLHERFDARVLLLVRRPDHTVGSFAARGWFARLPPRGDPSLPPTYREGEEPRHFFGRITPRGADRARWAESTPLGRIAWFWAARNRAILEQLGRLPAGAARIARLEELDHAGYAALAPFLGWSATVGRAEFDALAAERPNAGPNAPRLPADWSPAELAEHEREVAGIADALGYEWRISELAAGAPVLRGPAPAPGEALARAARG